VNVVAILHSRAVAAVGMAAAGMVAGKAIEYQVCMRSPHRLRFRALALFGRRLSERADGLGMPASENLHNSGSQHTVI
jgi:hypothetical protein